MECETVHCENIARQSGYCKKCANNIASRERRKKLREMYNGCKIEGCKLKHYENGYCQTHYKQLVVKFRYEIIDGVRVRIDKGAFKPVSPETIRKEIEKYKEQYKSVVGNHKLMVNMRSRITEAEAELDRSIEFHKNEKNK